MSRFVKFNAEGFKYSNFGKRHIIVRTFFILMIVAGILLLVYALDNSAIFREKIDGAGSMIKPDEHHVEINGITYKPKKNLDTTLIIGVDKSEDRESGKYSQSDVLLLFVNDTKNKHCDVIQLDRDTMTDVRVLNDAGKVMSTGKAQLALSHAYGGTEQICCQNTVWSVSQLFGGVRINNYVSLTMDSVSVLNDLVGGVTVEVLDDIDETLRKGETVTLTGAQALNYVRARKSLETPTNIRRMERQRQYLTALKARYSEKKADDGAFVTSSLTKLNDYMVSSCTIEQLSELAEHISTYEMGDIIVLKGRSAEGEKFMEFYVDETDRDRVLAEVFYEPVK